MNDACQVVRILLCWSNLVHATINTLWLWLWLWTRAHTHAPDLWFYSLCLGRGWWRSALSPLSVWGRRWAVGTGTHSCRYPRRVGWTQGTGLTRDYTGIRVLHQVPQDDDSNGVYSGGISSRNTCRWLGVLRQVAAQAQTCRIVFPLLHLEESTMSHRNLDGKKKKERLARLALLGPDTTIVD